MVIDAECVAVRSLAGHGDQAELTIQTRRGRLTLRLVARPGRALRCRCHRCGTVFSLVGSRLTDDALRTLLDHVRSVHPSVGLPADARAGAILAHFDTVTNDAA